jgi:Gpi18-like mannosyltransferase
MFEIFNTKFKQYSASIFANQQGWKMLIGLSILARMILFLTDGHNSDFDFFENWADRIVQFGFNNIYSIQVDRFECDYPPLYLYVVGAIGHLFNFFQWPIHTHFFDSFLKSFNLIVELIFLHQFYKISKQKIFLLLMLISPVTLLNAYGWGQIDIIYAILIFCSLYALIDKKIYWSAFYLGLSLSLKSQTLLFLPLFGLLLIVAESKWIDKFKALLLFAIVFLLPNLPFILWAPNPMDSINPHLTAAGRYNFISVNAFNIYWALWADFQLKLKLLFPPNNILVLGLISRKWLAYGLFTIIYTWLLSLLAKHKSPEQIFRIFAFFCFSYFMFLPEMHERYLFPFFIFSAYLCSFNFKEFKYLLIVSILHSLNLLWGWGEQKYIKTQIPFELSRLVAFITFTVWCAYAIPFYRFFYPSKAQK